MREGAEADLILLNRDLLAAAAAARAASQRLCFTSYVARVQRSLSVRRSLSRELVTTARACVAASRQLQAMHASRQVSLRSPAIRLPRDKE